MALSLRRPSQHTHTKWHQCRGPYLVPLPHVNCCLCCDGAIAPSIATIAVYPHHRCAVHCRRHHCIAIALAVLALFLAALIPHSLVGCCTDASTSRHLPPLVRCCPPCRHLLVLFLVCRLVVVSTPPPLVLSCLFSAAILLAPASSSSFSAAAPVVVIVDDDNDKEDNGVILSGASAVVGIIPVIVVVDNDNDEEDGGIILSGISVVVGIVASLPAIAITKPSQSRRPAAQPPPFLSLNLIVVCGPTIAVADAAVIAVAAAAVAVTITRVLPSS